MPSAGVSAGSLAPDLLTNLVNSCFESLGFMWCVMLSGLTFVLRQGGPGAFDCPQRRNPALAWSTLVRRRMFHQSHSRWDLPRAGPPYLEVTIPQTQHYGG